MQDLYNSKLRFGAEDLPHTRYYLAAARKPFDRKFYLEKLDPPGGTDNFLNVHEGVARIRKGLYALISEESGIFKVIEDTFYEHEKCELVNIEFIKLSHPFLSIKKKSQFKEILRVK